MVAAKRGRPPKAKIETEPRVIERGISYPLDLFKEITGLGPQGLRDAQAEGLRVVYVGKNAFVAGDDWINFLVAPERRTKRWESPPGGRKPVKKGKR